MWSEVEVLKLAAGVESNTIHPVGKAIVEAARAASCKNVKVHMHLMLHCFSHYYSWKARKQTRDVRVKQYGYIENDSYENYR